MDQKSVRKGFVSHDRSLVLLLLVSVQDSNGFFHLSTFTRSHTLFMVRCWLLSSIVATIISSAEPHFLMMFPSVALLLPVTRHVTLPQDLRLLLPRARLISSMMNHPHSSISRIC